MVRQAQCICMQTSIATLVQEVQELQADLRTAHSINQDLDMKLEVLRQENVRLRQRNPNIAC